ncbi:MAG: hypothetical protein Q27BB25_04560 [Blastomonas sp. CACIA14H2]|nr:MAG: hypothetical protein Q27BB25_04560 [Blastomonas sp. CACIA14H2]
MRHGLRRHASDIGSRLSLASDRLDRLCRDVSLGVRDQRQFDEMESEAQAIAADIVAAFRQPDARPGGCTNPRRCG